MIEDSGFFDFRIGPRVDTFTGAKGEPNAQTLSLLTGPQAEIGQVSARHRRGAVAESVGNGLDAAQPEIWRQQRGNMVCSRQPASRRGSTS